MKSSIILIAVGLLAAAARAQVSPGAAFDCPQYGFSIRSPREWDPVPIAVGEKRIVASYISPKQLQSKKDWNWHRPEMRVVVVPKARDDASPDPKDDAKAKAKEITARLGGGGGDYHDFPEYVENQLQGGHVLDKQEKLDLQGVPAVFYKYIPSGINDGHGVMGMSYQLEDCVVLVYFEYLQDFTDKFEPGIKAVLKSFHKIDKATPAKDTKDSKDKPAGDADPGKKGADRKQTAEDYYKDVLASLPKGWTSKRTKRFLIVSDTDSKIVDKVATFVERMRDHLEREYPPDPKVQPIFPVVRICKSADESNALGSQGFNRETAEVVTFADRNWFEARWAYRIIAYGLYSQYMFEQFEGLDLPPWLDHGLRDYYGDMVPLSTGQIKVAPDTYQVRDIKIAMAKSEHMSLKALLAMTDEEYQKKASGMTYSQPWSLIYFLKEGKSSYAHVIADYMGNLILAKEEQKSKDKKPEAAAAEAEKAKKARGKIEWPGSAVQKKAFEMTFGTWTDADWKKFENAWLRYWD